MPKEKKEPKEVVNLIPGRFEDVIKALVRPLGKVAKQEK